MRRTPIDDELIQLVLAAPRPEREELVLDLELITPMIGGGSVPGRVDRDMPIRASEIVGHVRTWWRRQFGYGYVDMKDREAAIFGAAAGDEGRPSGFEIEVEVREMGAVETIQFENGRSPVDRDLPQYVFSLLLQGGNSIEVLRSCKFLLRIRNQRLATGCYSKAPDWNPWAELVATVRLWCTYGGVGARTTRGCGALMAKQDGKLVFEAPKPIHLAAGISPSITLERYAVLFGPAVNSKRQAHVKAVDFLYCLAKGYEPALAARALEELQDIMRESYGLAKGRNARPEWRHLVHSQWKSEIEPAGRGFSIPGADRGQATMPRARLGLPRGYGDGMPTLEGWSEDVATRWPSSIIVRPLACPGQNGGIQIVPFVLVFESRLLPQDVRLRDRRRDQRVASVSLRDHAPRHLWGGREPTDSLIDLVKAYGNAINAKTGQEKRWTVGGK